MAVFRPGPRAPEELVTMVSIGCVTMAALIAACQVDAVSRKLLGPATLYEKRRRAQQHRFDIAVAKYNKSLWPIEIQASTAILDTPAEFDALLDEVMCSSKGAKGATTSNTTSTRLEIVSIVREINKVNDIPMPGDFLLVVKKIVTVVEQHNEKEDNSDTPTPGIISETYIQMPLLEFGLHLATRMESEISTTTFCFVADASAGLGLDMLEAVVDVAARDPTRGVMICKQPLWMVAFCTYVQQSSAAVSQAKLAKVLFGLCRLQARSSTMSQQSSSQQRCRTFVVTLPTQSTVAPLLPLLQTAFPSERHVFAYSGAAASVSRATSLRSKSNLMLNKITNTPLQSLGHMIPSPKYKPSLADLSASHAEALEAWMSSVDCFFRLKDDEVLNGYLPYTLGLKYLFSNINTTKTNGNMPTKRLALTNVLHYMLGNSAQAKHQAAAFETLLDDCFEALEEFTSDANVNNVTEPQRVAMEAVVFCHKSILIGDKTLLDTVLPKVKWSLKESKKVSGCACCAPMPGDDDYGDDEYNPIIGTPLNAASAGASATADGAGAGNSNSMGLFDPNNVTTSTAGLRQRPNAAAAATSANTYVDGKMGFAFDPSKFGGPRM
jgi:hypothetical protein